MNAAEARFSDAQTQMPARNLAQVNRRCLSSSIHSPDEASAICKGDQGIPDQGAVAAAVLGAWRSSSGGIRMVYHGNRCGLQLLESLLGGAERKLEHQLTNAHSTSQSDGNETMIDNF